MSYTYGDPNHLDAAASVGTTYTVHHDAAGDMTCRAPSNTVTCASGCVVNSGEAWIYLMVIRLMLHRLARS